MKELTTKNFLSDKPGEMTNLTREQAIALIKENLFDNALYHWKLFQQSGKAYQFILAMTSKDA